MPYQFIKINFISNPAHFTEDSNNQPPYKDIDLSIKPKEVADLPDPCDSLYLRTKFYNETRKAGYPEGEAKVNKSY
jgi:hypothetical protein